MELNALKEKLYWRWNRLRCMAVGEIKARLYHLIKIKALKLGFFSAATVPEPSFSKESKNWICEPNFFLDSQEYCKLADRILEEEISFFAIKKPFSEIIQNWNRDPKTGINAPLSFGLTLNCGDPSKVGDIKYLWEPNRFLFLVPLAQAYYLSGNVCYLETLESAMSSWFDQCPYLQGPNWASSLELGIRLINWSIIWQLIGAKNSVLFQKKEGKDFLSKWMQSVYQHIHFINKNLSFHSSANNHLIGEVAGLFIATTTWPFWPELENVRQKAYRIIEKEALQQNAEDGTNREQATSYQQFVIDFLIMAGLAGQMNGCRFSDAYWQRIESMIEFIGSLNDVGNNTPQIGDGDDGFVSWLSPEKDFCNYQSQLATGAVLFARQDFKAKAKRLDHKTCWLMGKKAVEMFAALNTESTQLPMKRVFGEGGYYILGKDFETDSEIKCIVSCGPLGYLSIAAHGHAAALSIYLSIGGREILIDPGTYTYHGNDIWRHYFRGTSAHCTLCVDDLDQSLSGGKFMWIKHASAQCETWQTGDWNDKFIGSHDGYMRLADPVIHKREVVFDKTANSFKIKDFIQCKKEHRIKRFWHFSEDCKVVLKDHALQIENNGVLIVLTSEDSEKNIYLVKGNKELPLGWISREFDRKSPSFTAVMENVVSGNCDLSSTIDIKAISLG